MTSQADIRCLNPKFQGNVLGLSKSSKEVFLCSFGQKSATGAVTELFQVQVVVSVVYAFALGTDSITLHIK